MRRKWLVALVPVVAVGLALAGRPGADTQEAPRVTAMPAPSVNPVVGVAQGSDYSKTTLDAIQKAGGLEGIVGPGKTVFIKPNIVGASPSGAGRITDYRVVQAIADECNRLGAKKVIVGESPVEVAWAVGMAAADYDRLKGVELFNTNVGKDDCYSVVPERSLSGQPFWLPQAYLNADVLISVPVLKTHYTAGVTLGLKNLGIGVPPVKMHGRDGYKSPLHDIGINKVIPDINSIRKPDFVVIDGMVGGEGEGPTNPDPVKCQLVIAGRDVVAVDTVGTLVMGFDPYKITHLVYAAAEGVGEMDISKIRVAGKSIAQVQQAFAPPPPQGYPFIRTTVIREAAAPVKIDGSLQEWSKAWVNSMTGPLTATTMATHDRRNLYFAFQVADDMAVAQTAYKDHEKPLGDGVEVLVTFNMPFESDMNGARQWREEGKDFTLLVAYNPKMVGVYTDHGKKPIPGTKAVALKTPSGYAIEACVPLASLGQRELTPRQELWMDFGVVDIDKAGQAPKARALWSGGLLGAPYDNPSTMGRALVDSAKYEWGK